VSDHWIEEAQMGEELAGKVAVVTGGSSGIGRATVESFVREGASVVIADIDTTGGEELAAALGPAAAFKRTDVADRDEVQELVDFAVGRFGGLHVMFNNAGISGSMSRFLHDDLSDFSRVMSVNLFGVMVGSQRAARHMAANHGGSIINNASIAGINAGAGVVTYRASKAAVIHFSRSIALDLAQYGIRVNCVAPAHIPTSITSYDQGPVIRLTQPLPRQGRPEDVANAVLYLAGDRSAQVTGVTLPVDGGTTAGPPASQMKAILAAAANDAHH
jgi:NAD(P)-dependent dehydrogenase (short-subunit alcohol dehydrogenase family)